MGSIGPMRNLGSQYLLNSGGLVFRFEDPASVPEPTSMLLIGSGLALLATRQRRRPRED